MSSEKRTLLIPELVNELKRAMSEKELAEAKSVFENKLDPAILDENWILAKECLLDETLCGTVMKLLNSDWVKQYE